MFGWHSPKLRFCLSMCWKVPPASGPRHCLTEGFGQSGQESKSPIFICFPSECQQNLREDKQCLSLLDAEASRQKRLACGRTGMWADKPTERHVDVGGRDGQARRQTDTERSVIHVQAVLWEHADVRSNLHASVCPSVCIQKLWFPTFKDGTDLPDPCCPFSIVLSQSQLHVEKRHACYHHEEQVWDEERTCTDRDMWTSHTHTFQEMSLQYQL